MPIRILDKPRIVGFAVHLAFYFYLLRVLPATAADSVVAEEPRLKVHENGDGAAVVQRQNTGARHEEGIKHITPELREAASHANSVDEALHEFLSAKFCDRLKEAGLLEEPLVARELATYELLDRR